MRPKRIFNSFAKNILFSLFTKDEAECSMKKCAFFLSENKGPKIIFQKNVDTFFWRFLNFLKKYQKPLNSYELSGFLWHAIRDSNP